MKVILIKEVPSLGHLGEIKEVSNGYAVNYLIPNGLADSVTKHKIFVIQAQKRKKDKLKVETLKNKTKIAEKINGFVLEMRSKADQKGSLYAAIRPETISQELIKLGYDISPKEVRLEKPIKKTGNKDVDLVLLGKKVKIKLIIKEE